MSLSPDTIFALSSGRPAAAIAVVRISGPRASEVLKALGVKAIKPREAKFARLRDPQSGGIIDEAVVLWFPGPRSETGEDVAELQVHGGRAIVAAILAVLEKIEGLRPAEAGEFARRAFENGKLDLTALEGLADLVIAETEGQRRQALRQMQGALGQQGEKWRARLVEALALVEAGIDFVDESDVSDDLVAPALVIARELQSEIAKALAEGARGERLRDGLVVAIAGPPNAGKSTLLNRLARREAAIVSPYAGTTRDVIEVHLDLAGLPVTLLDTAGIRETADPVEMEGVRRAQARAAGADLVLWVEDATVNQGSDIVGPSLRSETSAGPIIWRIRNKIDVLNQSPGGDQGAFCKNEQNGQTKNSLGETNESELQFYELRFNISAVSGTGLDALLAALAQAADRFLGGTESALITRARHRQVLTDALSALGRAVTGPLAQREELLAEELRAAAVALGRLTGRVDVEDILEIIFRDFCIGK